MFQWAQKETVELQREAVVHMKARRGGLHIALGQNSLVFLYVLIIDFLWLLFEIL